jgi:hypothetical protein
MTLIHDIAMAYWHFYQVCLAALCLLVLLAILTPANNAWEEKDNETERH